MQPLTGYRKLIVYQKAKELTIMVYAVSKQFPREEVYGLTSQARRAAASIMLNIVEGYSKGSTKEFARFLDIAIGSSNELTACLELTFDLGYLSQPAYNQVAHLHLETAKLLYAFQNSLRRRIKERESLRT